MLGHQQPLVLKISSIWSPYSNTHIFKNSEEFITPWDIEDSLIKHDIHIRLIFIDVTESTQQSPELHNVLALKCID